MGSSTETCVLAVREPLGGAAFVFFGREEVAGKRLAVSAWELVWYGLPASNERQVAGSWLPAVTYAGRHQWAGPSERLRFYWGASRPRHR